LTDDFKSLLNEYESVFPKDLPPPPPERLVLHRIDLKPGTVPQSKRPYRNSPAEMQEVEKVI